MITLGAAIASVVFLGGVGFFGFNALQDAREMIDLGPGFVGKVARGRYEEASDRLSPERRARLKPGELQRIHDDVLEPIGKIESNKIANLDGGEKPGAARSKMVVTVVGANGSARCEITLASTPEGLRVDDFKFERL
ncbi:MAG TPA: hypothetical protein VKE69_03570 [Planctomycetota bacterium]|nr:hypothetical protein [Planctomycetota bacterium]